ncbi:alanine--glyoxylate aminotransferase family protein, partial [Streptomyces mesophilus]
LAAGGGALAHEMIRVNHYGPDARTEVVERALAVLGDAVRKIRSS